MNEGGCFVWVAGSVALAAVGSCNLALLHALFALCEKLIVKFRAFTLKMPEWSSLLAKPSKKGLRNKGSVTVN